MRTIKLYRDHTEYRGGKKIVYKRGETIEVDAETAAYLARAEIEARIRMRERAKAIPGTPERKKEQEQW